MEKIIWKKHPLYKDYETNNLGEARCTRYANKEGNVRMLKQKIDKYSNGKRISVRGKTLSAHRFVYECFNGLIPEGFEIDHIDGNHANNNISNLRLCTHKENCHNPITLNRYKAAKRVEIIAYNKETKEVVGVHSSEEWGKILNVDKADIQAAARMKYIFEYIKKT